MPCVRCGSCGRTYRVRPIWRRSRRGGLRCACGGVEPLGAAFWLHVLFVRLALVAAGAAFGVLAALGPRPDSSPPPEAVLFGAAAGALIPELTRLRRRTPPKERSPSEGWRRSLDFGRPTAEVPVAEAEPARTAEARA